jgi:hypothetical protein
MLIPYPAVSLSCFSESLLLIFYTVASRVFCIEVTESLADLTVARVLLNTLSKVVIPNPFNPGTLVVLTTTASERVIGTNSFPS